MSHFLAGNVRVVIVVVLVVESKSKHLVVMIEAGQCVDAMLGEGMLDTSLWLIGTIVTKKEEDTLDASMHQGHGTTNARLVPKKAIVAGAKVILLIEAELAVSGSMRLGHCFNGNKRCMSQWIDRWLS